MLLAKLGVIALLLIVLVVICTSAWDYVNEK